MVNTLWRGARAVEWTRLESEHSRKAIVGSNPTLSAQKQTALGQLTERRCVFFPQITTFAAAIPPASAVAAAGQEQAQPSAAAAETVVAATEFAGE